MAEVWFPPQDISRHPPFKAGRAARLCSNTLSVCWFGSIAAAADDRNLLMGSLERPLRYRQTQMRRKRGPHRVSTSMYRTQGPHPVNP